MPGSPFGPAVHPMMVSSDRPSPGWRSRLSAGAFTGRQQAGRQDVELSNMTDRR